MPDLTEVLTDNPAGLGAVLAVVLPEPGRELILLIDQFEEAFTLASVAVESALAAALVSDAANSPGSLPLLQYALTELYEHRVDGAMTADAYHRLGGMGAVLSQRAEEIYADLDADDQQASRRLFSRLITPGEATDDTRRRANQSELAPLDT